MRLRDRVLKWQEDVKEKGCFCKGRCFNSGKAMAQLVNVIVKD